MSTADRFAEALRPGVMGPRLAAVAGDPAARRVQTCHVLDAKLEPGVSAVVLYGHAGRLLRGDLLAGTDDEAADRCAVVAPGVRVDAFPLDPDLPHLPLVMDAARLGPVLSRRLAAASRSDGLRSTRCRTRLLRYRPGKRATVLVTFGAGPTAYVAKAYHDPAKAASVAGEAPELSVMAATRSLLRFAPTVAHVPELALVVQQAVRGAPLGTMLSSTRLSFPHAREAVGLAAQALAELHASPALSSRERPVERELHRFGVRAQRVGTVDPELGQATGRLAHRLSRIHAELPAARSGLVHGDCKPSQFLLTGRQVYLLDLDHVGVSDQAADIGTFLASLRQLATRHVLAGRSPTLAVQLLALAEEFLEVYLDNQGDDGLRARARWQEAVALERKALRAFARAPRSPLAAALVKEANRCLDGLTGAQ